MHTKLLSRVPISDTVYKQRVGQGKRILLNNNNNNNNDYHDHDKEDAEARGRHTFRGTPLN